MEFKVLPNDLVMIFQFGATNDYMVPGGIWLEKVEEVNASLERREANETNSASTILFNGIIQDDEVKSVNIQRLPLSLWDSRYEIKNALYQKRRDQRNPKIFYHMVRFTYVLKDQFDKEEQEYKDFLRFRGLMMSGFQDIANTSFWDKLRIYRNPLAETDGKTMLSINFDGRIPLFENTEILKDVKVSLKSKWSFFLKRNSFIIDNV